MVEQATIDSSACVYYYAKRTTTTDDDDDDHVHNPYGHTAKTIVARVKFLIVIDRFNWCPTTTKQGMARYIEVGGYSLVCEQEIVIVVCIRE